MADSPMGKWGTVEFGIPDFLEGARDAVNDFAELLITALEIVNVALEFAKAFLKSYLDPLVAIIEAIIAEIVAIINDIKEIGIYITGDWALLAWPPEDLRGGFSEYERRMIARLTDKTDPTRPDISSATKTFGFFGYVSVDPSEFERLINFILSLMKMFSLSFFPDSSNFPVPIIKDTLYGAESANVFNFMSMLDTLNPTKTNAIPDKVRVTWVAQPASAKHPLNPYPQVGPKGYLVTVSTIPDGILLKYARSKSSSDKKETGDGKKVQPRDYGAVLSQQSMPVVLHGGAEMLAIKGSDYEYNKNIDPSTGAPRDGSHPVFGLVDPASNEVIPLETLGEAKEVGTPGDGKGSKFLLQRTFLIESGQALAQWFAGEYSTVLEYDDMPHAARFERQADNTYIPKDDGRATTYYVRAWSTGGQVASRAKTPQWDFTSSQAKTNGPKAGQPFIIDMKAGGSEVGNPSVARQITFPNANTQQYLQAVQTALLMVVLARPDLPLLEELTPKKTEEITKKYAEGKWLAQAVAIAVTGLESSKHLLPNIVDDVAGMSKPGQDPKKWRAQIYTHIKELTLRLYERTGPLPKAEQAVVESTKDLRNLTWSSVLAGENAKYEALWVNALHSVGLTRKTEPTLFESFNPENPACNITDAGCCPNIHSTGLNPTDVDDLFFHKAALRNRESDFVMWSPKKITVVGSLGGGTNQRASEIEVIRLQDNSPKFLREFYQKHTTVDPETKVVTLKVPEDERQAMEAKLIDTRTYSSGDFTPVFMVGRSSLAKVDKSTTAFDEVALDGSDPWPEGQTPALMFTRGLLRDADSIQNLGTGKAEMYAEASLALQVASAAFGRPPKDGEWIAIRLLDAWPELEDFLTALENWVKGLAEAVKSMADAIIKYIEFVQAQIVELQQLIRRINAMIQSLLSFSFALPKFSGLMLLSDGTDGVMADLAAAEFKPSDSPLAYGGGVALVIPFGPKFIFDIISILGGEEQDINGTTTVTRPPPAIGVEALPPDAGPAPTDEPDVL